MAPGYSDFGLSCSIAAMSAGVRLGKCRINSAFAPTRPSRVLCKLSDHVYQDEEPEAAQTLPPPHARLRPPQRDQGIAALGLGNGLALPALPFRLSRAGRIRSGRSSREGRRTGPPTPDGLFITVTTPSPVTKSCNPVLQPDIVGRWPSGAVRIPRPVF